MEVLDRRGRSGLFSVFGTKLGIPASTLDSGVIFGPPKQVCEMGKLPWVAGESELAWCPSLFFFISTITVGEERGQAIRNTEPLGSAG